MKAMRAALFLALLAAAHANTAAFTVDLSSTTPFAHPWEECAGSGHAV